MGSSQSIAEIHKYLSGQTEEALSVLDKTISDMSFSRVKPG